MSQKLWRGLSWATLLAFTACVDLRPITQELAALRAQIEQQNKRFETVEQDMQDGFRIALCRPEIRQLLDDVRAECTKPTPNQPTATAMCETKQIHPAVISADPEHKGRFLKFMSMLRHEAFYMKRGASEIIKFRRERLERLAGQPVLKNTTFLVVAHPAPGDPERNVEAMKRAKIIADKLKQKNSDIDDQRITIWIYEFPVGRAEIDSITDRPGPGEPADFNMSVWVFRADC